MRVRSAPVSAPSPSAGRERGYDVLIQEVEPTINGDLADALLLIQHAAYAAEAALLHDTRIPPLHECVEGLRNTSLRWLAAFEEGRLIGALAWKDNGDELDIDRLMVIPSAHRRGAGRALVREVLRLSVNRRVIVSTGRDNFPAKNLYERLGLCKAEDTEVVPGLWVSHYVHNRRRDCPAADLN